MWSRRAFLEYGSYTLAAMTCLETRAAAQPGTGPLGRPIGLQLYTVREDATKDLPATLKAIAAIGYREVELAGMPPVKAAELRTMLTDLGLTAPSMHAGMADLQSGLQERIDYAKALGTQHIVCSFPWTADSRFRTGGSQALAAGITLADWQWNADELNRIGELTRKAGIRCGYHNHNMEFRTYEGLADGLTAFDELLKRTMPELVTIELDIAWVVTAGIDPLQCLRKHPQRISLLHVKEVRKDLKTMRDRLVSQTTEVGSGAIDWKTLFAAMNPRYIRHYFVEQENFERPPLEAVKISYEYLRKLGS